MLDGSDEDATDAQSQQEDGAESTQVDDAASADATAVNDAQAEENARALAALQAENEKLRHRVDKLKRKVHESEQLRQETEEQARQAIAAATTAAAAAATNAQAGVEESAKVAAAPASEVVAAAATALTPSTASGGVKAKDHPDFAKYFKLLSMGLQPEQVKMKMQQSGVDPSVLDDPDGIIGGASPDAGPAAAAAAPAAGGGALVKDDAKYAKFFKLLKMGMPAEQIKLKMSAEGLDPELLDTPDAPMPGSGGAAAASGGGVMTVKEDPAYEKFFKLLKMGMPAEQIKLKMSAVGLNADLLDTPDAPSPNSKGGSTGGGLAGLPPPTEAVKVDPAALKTSLSAKLVRSGSAPKKPEEPQLPKRPTVKPNVELRPLFWTRMPVNIVKSTVWMKLNDEHAEIDVEEMEWMFRKNPVDPSKKQEEKKKDKESAQPQLVLLLDPKRQQNVSIAIARFKMATADIKEALYALDETKLSSEIVNVLISISPSLEEQDLLKNYDGDEKLLGNVEKFFLELLTIPRYTQRIKCFRYKLQFENRILETQAQLDTLVAATDQVAESDKFRRVLEHVLAIGNYLNGSTPRGGAYGFKLDTLTKLHTLRSIDPRVTLMNFVLRQLEEFAPDVIAFAGEVPHITEAKRLSLDQLRADLSMYNTELAMLQGQVAASKSNKDEHDKFYEVMAPFAKDAAEVLEELGRDFNALEASYQELVGSFGEDPRKLSPIEFFTILDEFVTEFKKAYRQNQTKEYQAIYDTARQMREESNAATEAEREAKRQREAEERARREEAALYAEGSKELYAHIVEIITHWAEAHSDGNIDIAVDTFKAIALRFGKGEIPADDFCDQVRKCVGTKTASKVIPESINLWADPTRRSALAAAFDRFHEQIKREKEAKKLARANTPGPASLERGRSHSSGRPKRLNLAALKVDDIEPVVGEAAQHLHNSIIESVRQAFGGDAKKMKMFTSMTRKYGNEQITARDFYQYLTASFEPDFVGRLVPDLARLLQDAEKRHALIQALCESAAGWTRFSGL